MPETIEIFSVKLRGNGLRVFKITLEDVWKRGWYIRINNFADKEKQPHCEKDIRDQVKREEQWRRVVFIYAV